jgi:predicted transcriptional regulator
MTAPTTKKRNRPMVSVTLDPKMIERLDEIVDRLHSTRGKVVDLAIEQFEMPAKRR